MTTVTLFTAGALVAGNWMERTSGGWEVRHSPYSDVEASVAAVCADAEVEAARAFAIASARTMPAIPPFRRAEILERAAALLAARSDEVAALESTELGKPIKDTSKQVLRAGETLQIAASEARRMGGEVLPAEGWPAGAGSSAIAVRVPVGIVLAITPFNAPLNLLTHKIAAWFAAGNTTIVKSPPQDARGRDSAAPWGLRARWFAGADPGAGRRRLHRQSGGRAARRTGGGGEAAGAGSGR